MFSSNTSGPGVATDPQFNYVTMLLHGNGTNGAQNNTFLDSSTNNFTITRNGNTTQGTFTPYGNLWSNYFDGTGDYLTAPDNTALNFGTGDFCVECFFYPTTVSGTQGIVTKYAGGDGNRAFLFEMASGVISCAVYSGGSSTFEIIAGGTAVANAWNHLVLCRSGTTLSAFLNGIRTGTSTNSYSISSVVPVAIGAAVSTTGASPFFGYIASTRIVKGSSVYTPSNSTLTVPTAPLTAITNTSLLTCQSNRFIDNSSNAFTITRNGDVSVQRFSPFSPTAPYAAGTDGGSGYFDGSGDYLTAGAASNWQFLNSGASDYTIEAWVYLSSVSAQQFICATNAAGAAVGISFQVTSSATLTLEFTRGVGGSFATFTSTGTLTANAWNHVAVTFATSGKTATFYINGASAGSSSNTGFSYSTSNPSNTLNIGREPSGSGLVTGYISNLRIVSSIVYTAAFTPPTAPLTAITNTSLLTNFTNAGIIDNAEMNDLETVGNAQISTAQSKFGGASMAFDGSGDRLVGRNTPNLNFGSGDWTVEFWIYATDQVIGPIVNQCSQASSAGWGIWAYNGASGVNRKLTVFLNGANFSLVTGSDVWASNTWTHIAVVKSGTNLTVYSNGVNAASSSSAPATITDTTAPPMVGAVVSGTNWGVSYDFTGYIDDLRITKGYARYTANFTPPSAPFPDN